jgi:hypothetical protein
MQSAATSETLLVAAHDAGGAEVVSSWTRRHWKGPLKLVAEGPAKTIFQRKLPGATLFPGDALPRLVHDSQLLLTGTSWGSQLELHAIQAANACGMPSASYIDHWVNYEQRFIFNDSLILPNEIWVGDEFALDMARRTFPGIKLSLKPNAYFEDIRDELSVTQVPQRNEGSLRLLYVSEPIAEHFALPAYRHQHPGYDEFSAIANFLSQLESVENRNLTVRFRLHPSESPDKYAGIVAGIRNREVHFSEGNSLLEDCAWSDWVIGCESMAMVIGLIAGKTVFTSIPSGGRDCQLPQPSIRRFEKRAIAEALK